MRDGWRAFHLAELPRLLKVNDAGVSTPAAACQPGDGRKRIHWETTGHPTDP